MQDDVGEPDTLLRNLSFSIVYMLLGGVLEITHCLARRSSGPAFVMLILIFFHV